jgi:hypothetical protein
MKERHFSPAFFLMLAAALSASDAAAAVFNLDLDLTDGIRFHDEPTFTHPVDPPQSPNGEIEDNYFSPTLHFSPTTLNLADPASNILILDINFRSRSGAQQFLVLDAAGTGAPFPETFAIRFPGPVTHDTIGQGFSFGGGGTVGGIANGTVTTTLDGAIGDLAVNDYSVALRCFIDNCTTGPHFPGGRDLTDGSFLFGGMTVRLSLADFERCSLSRPDCEGITISSFGFGMLAGDISILQEVDAPRPIPVPGTMVLLGTGLAGLLFARRRSSAVNP